MKLSATVILRTSLVALGASLAMVPPAGAQNLFDLLFGGPAGHRYREYPRERRERPERRRSYDYESRERERANDSRKPAAAPKISAPSYYDYKVDSLVTPAFGEIRPAEVDTGFAPLPAGVGFSEALEQLEGFELRAERDIAAALVAHYSANPDFIWVSGYHANGRAGEAIRTLGEAASHGLDPAEYSVAAPPAIFSMDDMTARQRALIRFEMALSARALRYVRDAHGGRVDANRLSGYHDMPKKPLDLKAELAAFAGAGDIGQQLESHHPKAPQYQALRVELETLRASAENEIVVDPKMFVRPGGAHVDMPKLVELISRKAGDAFRQEHGVLIAEHRDSEVYSDALVPLIKAAQEENGLRPDGIIGPRTVEALAGNSKAAKVEKVLVALEQLRWLPAELGSTRVFVNQPAYTASFVDNGEEKLSMRVVIGTKANQTSFFYDEIEQVDYNPYWGVPQSILVNEMLPRLREDPGYLDRAGYEITDSNGRHIPSSSIDWWRFGSRIPYSVRQTPSEANALGELKILFPNKHAIYMHDTPQKHLFERDTRAYSHGCIRLANPRGMAAAVLGTSIDHIEKKLAQGHSTEKLKRRIPVYVSYFTAWPGTSGTVEYFGDIYERDPRVITALEKTASVRAAGS